MNVKLRQVSSLDILVEAIRTCYESNDNSDSEFSEYENKFMLGKKDKALIQRIIDFGHTSTLEHVFFSFYIEGMPRFTLQEHARHRMSSFSVKSTRYTLKELKTVRPFILQTHLFTEENMPNIMYNFAAAEKYIWLSGNPLLDKISVQQLETLRKTMVENPDLSNDVLKQLIPENYLCNLVWSTNLRSLRNYLSLRNTDKAHFVIHDLAQQIINVIPEDYHFLLGV